MVENIIRNSVNDLRNQVYYTTRAIRKTADNEYKNVETAVNDGKNEQNNSKWIMNSLVIIIILTTIVITGLYFFVNKDNWYIVATVPQAILSAIIIILILQVRFGQYNFIQIIGIIISLIIQAVIGIGTWSIKNRQAIKDKITNSCAIGQYKCDLSDTDYLCFTDTGNDAENTKRCNEEKVSYNEKENDDDEDRPTVGTSEGGEINPVLGATEAFHNIDKKSVWGDKERFMNLIQTQAESYKNMIF